MNFQSLHRTHPASKRDKALGSAITLRELSLRPQTTRATQRACRKVMREQALHWRELGAA